MLNDKRHSRFKDSRKFVYIVKKNGKGIVNGESTLVHKGEKQQTQLKNKEDKENKVSPSGLL
jgi:hypothetical protein